MYKAPTRDVHRRVLPAHTWVVQTVSHGGLFNEVLPAGGMVPTWTGGCRASMGASPCMRGVVPSTTVRRAVFPAYAGVAPGSARRPVRIVSTAGSVMGVFAPVPFAEHLGNLAEAPVGSASYSPGGELDGQWEIPTQRHDLDNCLALAMDPF